MRTPGRSGAPRADPRAPRSTRDSEAGLSARLGGGAHAGLREQLPRVDPVLLLGGANARFDHRHRREVVASARVRLAAALDRVAQLIEQLRVLGLPAGAAADEAWPLPALAKDEPAVHDVQGGAFAD